MSENEIRESGKIFALSMVLMNCLILTAMFSVFWLAQMILSQTNQFNALINGFIQVSS
jgi:hypothetical protein